MSRKSRTKGQFFHVIVRGIGKQILFENNQDRNKFLDLLERYRDETDIVIMAYCLMENHVHLLVNDPFENMSLFMKKLGISYASYYNKKYDRVGHLFQDRYKSELIVDDSGLLNVYRYILNNPVKAHISNASKYEWSSYKEFGESGVLTDTTYLVKLIGNKSKLDNFLIEDTEYEGIEFQPLKHDDNWAIEIIRRTLGVESGTALQQMTRNDRDESLVKLKEKGISVRQLERLTGINRNVIQRAKRVK